jgi:hypothetical protein
MAKKRPSKMAISPDNTIVDVINWRTQRRKRATWHAEVVRLRDEDPKRWSWGRIAKQLSAKQQRNIERDAVIKAYKRAKNPSPRPLPVFTLVIDHAARTVSFLPPPDRLFSRATVDILKSPQWRRSMDIG